MEAGAGPEGQMSEEEMRARLEEEVRRLRVEDLLMQNVAGVVNLTARRIVKEDERDLEQAQLGIESTKAVLEFLPEAGAAQVRQALSELQMLYARAASGEPLGGEEEAAGEGGGDGPEEPPQPPPSQQQRGSGLWTPPGS